MDAGGNFIGLVLPGDKSTGKASAISAPGEDELRLVWVDMEMTGLNPNVDRILEVAAVVTDGNLCELARSEVFAIYQPDEVLGGMDQWNRSVHGKTGLIDRVRVSRCSEALTEERLTAFLSEWVVRGKVPLCGNSVGQDRRFMYRYMPRLESWFHYRNVDVSVIKELLRRWRPAVLKGFTKKSSHTALEDVLESIDELRYYRDLFWPANAV